MDKPTTFTKAFLNYLECERYISEKLGYHIRDVNGCYRDKYDNPTNREIPCDLEYLDYWHFLTDVYNPSIHNGCYIHIGEYLLGHGGEPWADNITQAFIDEFGDDAEYWVSW